jgi:hypothetical protein
MRRPSCYLSFTSPCAAGEYVAPSWDQPEAVLQRIRPQREFRSQLTGALFLGFSRTLYQDSRYLTCGLIAFRASSVAVKGTWLFSGLKGRGNHIAFQHGTETKGQHVACVNCHVCCLRHKGGGSV